LFTFEFQFEFWGVLPAHFYPYTTFLSESKTPPGVPVRALVIEKRVQNLPEEADYLPVPAIKYKTCTPKKKQLFLKMPPYFCFG
jgi:hypothetical protein